MALSGSFSGSIRSGNYKLRVDWTATQSVSGNTSKITATMYLVQASSWGLNIAARSDNKTTINGTAHTWTSPAISNSGGKTTKLGTVTSGNIAHNADGTKSVTITAVFEINATISGTYYDTITASATITLDTIPRATQPSLSASSANMGASVTVSMPRAASSFTHDLAYKVGNGSYVSITTGQGTSYSWTVPDVASSIPNATSVQLTLRCITKSGSTTVGTKYAYITANVPTSVVPPAPSLAIQEGTEGLAAQFGAYVQNKSTLAVSIAATGIKGSTVKAIQTTVLGKTYTGAIFTTGLLTSSGTVTLATKVQDSRGRWSAAKTTTVTVLAYSPPKVQALRAYRVDASGAADEEGAYLRLDYKYSVSAVNNKNTVRAAVEYKRTTADEWTFLMADLAYSADKSLSWTSPAFPVDFQYDIRLTVTDFFGFASFTAILPTAEVIMDFLANGKGIALGKVAENEGFDLGFPIVGASAVTGAGILPLGGILLQWGNVNITPTAAGTPTTVIVTFQRPFTATPTVLLAPVSGVPHTLSVGTQRSTDLVGDPKVAMAVTLTREGTTTTGINWLAIGPG